MKSKISIMATMCIAFSVIAAGNPEGFLKGLNDWWRSIFG